MRMTEQQAALKFIDLKLNDFLFRVGEIKALSSEKIVQVEIAKLIDDMRETKKALEGIE